MLELRKAERKKSKLRIGLAGVSGSGKTYSAILMASGITSWDKIAVIDTEMGSADLYAHLGDYNVITLEAPFSPEKYIEAIKACESAGMEVIVIDSITHEWEGVGGCLELSEQLGGYPQGWKKVTPRHQRFIDSILQSKCHVITTVRRKQEYAMGIGDNGKNKVEKKGMKEITREGFEYELTLSLSIEQNHLAVASKDRTGLFMDKPDFKITPDIGRNLKEWAESGADIILHEPKPEVAVIIKPVSNITTNGLPTNPTVAGSTNLISDKQINMIFAIGKDLGWDAEKTKVNVYKRFKTDSLHKLTKYQASQCIEALKKKQEEYVEPIADEKEIQPDEVPLEF
jgi:hypothetical protein